ncbi:pyridoxine 5'-phosphate synthase [Neisseria gonorrhoeae]|uniref:Pyridoxine 5'-phosphate synthase n=1 Tax=Neisseria gonorrhoeae TaxID=485 RepID=A0A378VSY5_NEIGO|nr:pyridoxine 5'-phosphate synthase [Neisseria gonorrhoeae]
MSLFIDADDRQIQAAYDVGAPVVELHTGAYADAQSHAEQIRQFERIQTARISPAIWAWSSTPDTD